MFFFFLTLALFSFWATRGHRCRPFSPPALALNFYRAQGSAIPLLVDCPSSVAVYRSVANPFVRGVLKGNYSTTGAFGVKITYKHNRDWCAVIVMYESTNHRGPS